MESDEREVSGYNGRDGKTSATAKYDKIKNTVHPWWLARRGAQEEGEIVVPEGPVSGEARRVLRRRGSHTYAATHSAEKPTSAPTNNYPYYPIL